MNINQYVVIKENGPFLPHNEDEVLVDLMNGLYFVIDGLGGQGIGNVAAKDIISNLQNFILSSKQEDNTLPFYFSPRYFVETNILINACYYAQKKILEKYSSAPINNRGGATGVVTLLNPPYISCVCIGNGNIYLHRNGEIRPLFNNDNFQYSHQNLKNNYIPPLSAFGLYPDLHYHVQEMKINEFDQILICSDGISDYCHSMQINSILNSSLSNQDKSVSLTNLANTNGNLDNQSLILLQF